MATLKDRLNAASPDTLADNLRALGLGDMLRALPTYLTRKTTAATATQLATTVALVLPQDAKAATLLRAAALVGSGTPAELVNDGFTNTAPAAGHVSVAANGDILFAAADAWTSVEVAYMPEKQDLLTLTLPVVAASGVMAIPAAFAARLKNLIAATITVGGSTGTCIVRIPAAAAPGTTLWANLDLAKSQVFFRIADAVTQATVTLGLDPVIDVDASLEATTSTL